MLPVFAAGSHWIRGAFDIPPTDFDLAARCGISVNVGVNLTTIPDGRKLAVYPIDEPDLQPGMTPEKAANICRDATRRTFLPSFTVIWGGVPFGQEYRRYRDVADWMGADLYPYDRTWWKQVYNLLADQLFRLPHATRAFTDKTWFGVAQGFAPSTPARLLRWEQKFKNAGAAGCIAYSWPQGRDIITGAWLPKSTLFTGSVNRA